MENKTLKSIILGTALASVLSVTGCKDRFQPVSSRCDDGVEEAIISYNHKGAAISREKCGEYEMCIQEGDYAFCKDPNQNIIVKTECLDGGEIAYLNHKGDTINYKKCPKYCSFGTCTNEDEEYQEREEMRFYDRYSVELPYKKIQEFYKLKTDKEKINFFKENK